MGTVETGFLAYLEDKVKAAEDRAEQLRDARDKAQQEWDHADKVLRKLQIVRDHVRELTLGIYDEVPL